MGGEIHHGKPEFIKCDKHLPDSVRDKTRMVIGEFICDRISTITPPGPFSIRNEVSGCCLTYGEVKKYAGWDNPAVPQTELHNLYGWHISDLKIYNQPKDIMCFRRAVEENELWCKKCAIGKKKDVHCAFCYGLDGLGLRRPPQSWCYVEERYYG